MKKLIALIGVAFVATISQAQVSNSIPFSIDLNATNWVAIPYVAYDIESKRVGYGGALLYQVTGNFWAGARIQSLNNHQTTAAVQGQLNVPVKVGPFTGIPFVESSVGMGNSVLYANTGAGMIIRLYSHKLGKVTLYFDAIGDYEHYVEGSQEGNQANGGLILGIKF